MPEETSKASSTKWLAVLGIVSVLAIVSFASLWVYLAYTYPTPGLEQRVSRLEQFTNSLKIVIDNKQKTGESDVLQRTEKKD